MSLPYSDYKSKSQRSWRQKVAAKRHAYKQRPFFSSSPNKGWGAFFKKLVLTGIVAVVVGWFGLTIFIAWASRDLPDPNKLIERHVAQSTKIYDRTGEHLLYEVFSDKKRTSVELADIPEYAKWATIVVEDKNFYNHTGVAWLSIARAFASNLLGSKTGGGGASTMTQQLVKNAVLTNEKTYTRKIKEAILAKQIERKYTKDQILKLYFNEIPYGSSNYGIEAASESYFGKSVKEITLAEAATLAALPQAPTRYLNNNDLLLGRRNFVIDKLLETGRINQGQAETAKKEPLKINRMKIGLVAPHFVLYIKELLSEKYGEKTLEEGGLKVITTLDYDKQLIAEEEVKKGAEANEKKYKASNAALVSLDAKTGQILAMVGSRDFFDEKIDGQVNVTLRPRQPGSSFKPIVYAAGFAKGLTPETKVYDVETTFKTETEDYTPHDYDLGERGPISLRRALAGSLNIPAVKVLYLTGIDNVLNLAQQLGYTTLNDRSRFGLSLVLGGGEVKLLEHVHSFMALAREGTTIPASAILEVSDSQGNTLEKWSEPSSAQVIDNNVARTVTDILSDNSSRAYIFGENSPLILPDRPVAAKTGTTNEWIDGWTIGFTPSVVTGVWVGNNNNKPMAKKADGVLTAAPIWRAYMLRTLKDTPVEAFNPPDPLPTDIKPILVGQGLGEVTVNVNKLNGKLSSNSTPPDLIETKIFKQPHSILYYLNKDDIFGPPPADPSLDPNFTNWEDGVKKWSEKNGIFPEAIPTEYDDSVLPNLPKISITSPLANQTLNNRNLIVNAQVSSERGVKKVEFYLDDVLLKSVSGEPYSYQTYLWETPKGFHTIKAKVIDSSGYPAETKIDINLVAELNPPTLYFNSPNNNVVISNSRFPISINLNFHQPEKIKKVLIYLTNIEDNTPHLFSDISEPAEKNLNLTWSGQPSTGQYKFTSKITDVDNQTYGGGELIINVE
ncbi:MAG: transglycosylase domain-containing protein [Patescibacteria group bacterium]